MIESDVVVQFKDVTVATPSGEDTSNLSILVEGGQHAHSECFGLIVISTVCDIF